MNLLRAKMAGWKPAPRALVAKAGFRAIAVGRRRRGMSLLMVLLLVSITLGLSYAAIRSQHTSLQIQENSQRGFSARQAAVTGIAMAIENMQTSGWAVDDPPLQRSLGTYTSFRVEYIAGVPSDHPGHNDYLKYSELPNPPGFLHLPDFPYLVTLMSTGEATDPDNPACIATYRIGAVLRLIPHLADEPADWETMQAYTVYQSRKDPFEIDIPCRLEGPVRAQDKLQIAEHYPGDAGARWRYLSDLNKMLSDGGEDFRPLNGPVHFPYIFGEQDAEDFFAIRDALGVEVQHAAVDEAGPDWVKPTSLATYQIYAGGPVYTVQQVVGSLNDDLVPDPQTNPLGIYYYSGTVIIDANVTIRGSLFCKDDIRVRATGVKFEPIELPGLYEADDPVRLPVASCRNFIVENTGGATVTGLVAAFDQFRVDKSPASVSFVMDGRLIARKLYIKERIPWETASWSQLHDDFREHLNDGDPIGDVPYFPEWLRIRHGLAPKPRLTIKPDATPARYHWRNSQDPVYVADPNDGGLRWDLREWTENPNWGDSP